MARYGSTPFAFPEFHGTTRRLVLLNLFAYFALALLQLIFPIVAMEFSNALAIVHIIFLNGAIWQPLSYSLIHSSLV
jgi:hypothetical protein